MHYKRKVKLILGHYYKTAENKVYRGLSCTNIKMYCFSGGCKNRCLDLVYHSNGRKAAGGYALCADGYTSSTLLAELTPEEQVFYAL